MRVNDPTHAIVKRPTHFTLAVAPRNSPDATSQNHQEHPKAFGGPCSCWLENETKERTVKAVKMIRGESKRMKRDWVTSAFSSSC